MIPIQWDFWRKAPSSFENKVYRDEQITPQQPRERIPAPIRSIRPLERGPYAWRQSREQIFVKQAKLLEYYEDDYPFDREVVRYYPTYQTLSDTELRGYFSWRTAMRRGSLYRTSLSFAFLYIYELLNQIGCSDPADGYRRLKSFGAAYAELDSRITSYLDKWLFDYVIYYDLDVSLLSGHPALLFDRALSVLNALEEYSPKEIADAAAALSGYRPDRSRFFKEYPAETEAVLVRVLYQVKAHYEKACKQTWIEDYFGSFERHPVCLFETAVFYNRDKKRSSVYLVDPIRYYSCRNGIWYADYFRQDKKKKHKIGELMRSIDSQMRELYGYPHPVKAGLVPKWLQAIIDKTVRAQLEEKKQAERKVLHLDLSRLEHIRKDASYTMDRLIVGEEAGPAFEEASPEPAGPVPGSDEPAFSPAAREPEAAPAAVPVSEDTPAAAETIPEGSDSPAEMLTAAEYRYLHCLLYEQDTAWVTAEGLLPSVLADSINEKLFDLFSDTVLDDSTLIEDYIEELKEIIPK